MIRTVITADNKILSLPLPDDFIGKKIEVIAFTLDEAQKDVSSASVSVENIIFKTIKVNAKDFKFNRDELHER